MLFLASLFVLGSLWFWVTLFVISVLIITFDNFENEGKAFGLLLLFAAAVLFFNPGVWLAIKANPLLLLVGLLGYLVLGVVTAFTKWYFFLLNVRDAINEGETPSDEYRIGKTIKVRGRSVRYPIVVSNFKARITGWMTYWPWVALWTLIDDPIRRIFQRIYTAIAGQLQGMANRILPPAVVPPKDR